MTDTKNDDIVYTARLHWILFVWPLFLFLLAAGIGLQVHALHFMGLGLGLTAIFWEVVVWLTYQSSYIEVKPKQVALCTGIFVRQTIVLSTSKIESIDIRQSILGSIFHYGSLIITGTGGTRQEIHFLNSPLTCRRHIEQLMHH